MKTRYLFTALLLIVLFSLPLSILSQETDGNKDAQNTEEKKDTVEKKDEAVEKEIPEIDSFFPYIEDDPDMKAVKSEESYKTKGIQWGGWITPVMIDQRGSSISDTDKLASSIITSRLWVKSYLWNRSFAYFRVKDVFQKIISQNGYELDKTDNVFDLDLGFLSVWNDNRNIRFYLGRKFFLLGSGLVFNGRGDGAQFDFFSRFVDINLFCAYTGLMLKDNNPYSLNDKDLSNGSKRIFTGGSLSLDFLNQVFYLLGMAQFDRGEEDFENKRYQSQYYGAGLKGVLSKSVAYNGELVYEMGKSYTEDGTKADIMAFAALFNLHYYININTRPVLIFQYAYGSGDKDRDNYKLSTGNISGKDTGFQYFGTYVGGYAFRPLLANMHIIRGGFSIAPFSMNDNLYLKRMALIVKYSYYMKDKIGAQVNYGEGSEQELFIGQGVDLSLRWKIFNDLSAFINYAVFLPGNAFNETENFRRNFLMTGINISF